MNMRHSFVAGVNALYYMRILNKQQTPPHRSRFNNVPTHLNLVYDCRSKNVLRVQWHFINRLLSFSFSLSLCQLFLFFSAPVTHTIYYTPVTGHQPRQLKSITYKGRFTDLYSSFSLDLQNTYIILTPARSNNSIRCCTSVEDYARFLSLTRWVSQTILSAAVLVMIIWCGQNTNNLSLLKLKYQFRISWPHDLAPYYIVRLL